jgi:amino acid adenylation domain-containing protein/non-ribosomal peptide synthase protein (TIGR01720 family)
MSDLTRRVASLSPEKRALLMLRLAKKRAQVAPRQVVPRRQDLGSFPLSFAQERLWFLDQYEPDSPFYNIAAALRLTGPLNVAALEQSLNEILRRHEVLRAAFVIQKGRLVQVVAPELELGLPVVDLCGLPETRRKDETLRLATQEARQPFNLTRGPLLRVCLLWLGEEEHVALLTMHHIVSDGWSTGVLIQEIAALYGAFSTGKPSPLPEPSIQYADFACWQRQWLQGEVLESQLDYWRQRLGDSPPVLELPTDRPRSAVQTYHGAHYSFTLSKELSDALKTLGRQEDATLFMTLLAAFQTLLYRYTRQEDICVGTPIANRNRAEVEGLIGFFVNTLVVRTHLAGESSFRESLERVRETALEAYAHQDVPFEMLVDQLHPERSLSHTPLFQVVFVLQDALVESLELSGLKLSPLEIENGTAKFDLTLFVEERAAGLKGAIEYNTDLFDAATVERLARHFQTLLEGIVADPDRCIAALPLLTEADRQKMLVEWNSTTVPYTQDRCLHQLFEAQVERTPEAGALVWDGRQLTYCELNRRANQLAHHLQALGVGPEAPVGIYMERSLEIIVAIWGILKAGSAYVPLDPSYPKERMTFMLQDTQLPVLVTQESFVKGLTTRGTHVVCLDVDWKAIARESDENPLARVTAQDYAYVLYTSGSTGRPKGVCCHHAGVVNLLEDFDRRQPIRVGDNGSWWTSPNFDVSVYEIFSPLLCGGTLHIVSEPVRPDAARFAEWLSLHNIQSAYIPPFMLADFSAWLHRQGGTSFMHRLLVGVEPIPEPLLVRINARVPALHIINGYGPTETTICSTLYSIRPRNAQDRTTPIGQPVQNNQVYLFDERLQLVPIGAPGQVYIGGVGVSHGYLNRPGLTAERFVPHPFSARPGARLYKTGDLAHHLSDGNIEFLGRMDFQVKVRGFRIELGEVQKVLGQHPGVRDVVVLVREDTPGDKRLVAYVVPEEVAPGVGELRSFLKEKLPEYMVPSAFVLLEAFPLTPNGKVDRRALPAPERTRDDLDKIYVAPRTAVERFLVERWQDILDIDRVGIHDNFFELGGDSLQAAVLINRLQEELNVTAHVKALFMAPTVAELGRYLAEYYPDAAAKIGETESLDAVTVIFEQDVARDLSAGKRVDASTVAQMRQLITPLSPRQEHQVAKAKNPPAIFVLSPPRSGSTLLRTMLAGHPRLFSPPELDLLSFNTLDERRAVLSGGRSFWLEGVFRAIMEATGCDIQEAQRIMDEYESQKLTTKQLYGLLQKWIAPRILVDKTPVYPLDLEILERMETDFENTLYIHLVRHPYATVYSFVEAKLDQVFFRHEHPFPRRGLAELVWIISHQNILEFLKTVPEDRQHRVVFEDLVTRPEAIMKGICQFLDVEFHPALVRPYEGQRMTNGIRPGAQMVGDFKFYLRKEIDPGAADRWKKFHSIDFLSDIAWQVAGSLGYERPVTPQAGVRVSGAPSERPALADLRPIPRDGDLPLSFSQQRLWFLDQFEPGSPFYNIPSAVRLTGRLNVAAFERCLNEIVRRQQVLRTTFATVDGRAVQIIAPKVPRSLPVVDLRDVPQAEREAVARQLVADEAQQPFDLARGPLARACLLRLDQQEYLFLLTAHHIVSDGWSTRAFIRELAALYEAFATGKPSPLSELPIQYVDYAYWQREWLRGEVLESQLAYWEQQLADSPPILELPADRPRPAVQTLRGSTLWFDLPKSLSDAIRALGRQEKASLFMTLLAAFQALLYRYTGQEDVSVGTPIANRNRAEIEGLIGFFVNTLVLRTDLSGDPGFRELLARVREVAVSAYAHQDVPFEMLVDALQPERDMSHTPLFQVMFTLQDAPARALKLPGLTLSPVVIDNRTAKFDLTLAIVDKAEGLRGSLEYNTDLFDGGTIERVAGHFQVLLAGIVADPDRRISALPLLTQTEQRQLLAEWNGTATPYPQERCIPHLFEAQAARTPDAVAVVFQEEQLTYADLNRRANQLAHHLHGLGVEPEVAVGVCVVRSVEMVVGLLGILKAGRAYVPLDPTYPQERLAFMLADARTPVLLTQQQLLENLPEYSARVVCLDSDWETIAQESETNPVRRMATESLAYVIYTSGSTGRPKGVQIEHRALLNLIFWHQRAFAVSRVDRATQVAGLAFDASVWELWPYLAAGASIHLPNEETRASPERLRDWLEAQGITISFLPTPLAEVVLPLAWPPKLALRTLLTGGEKLHRYPAPGLPFELVNNYGPTENTVVTTSGLVPSDGQTGAAPSIGRPIANAQLYVLDRHLQPVPVGAPGELHVGGDGLARGYLNRPELTAEKFIPHPFNGKSGTRLYKTGDLVRYLSDGNIEFLGRVDYQVKVRGFRIELGEIEAVLGQHPTVRETIVLIREDTPGDRRLVAYVVPRDEQTPAIGELRHFLKEKLPDYMAPSAFVALDALPLTPNGKVNRRALPAPDQARPEVEAAYVAPRTHKEQILADVWAQVLGVEQVGVHDNFFELGGDSILSIQVIARASQAGLRLTPRQLFETPTVAGLAAMAGTGPTVQAEQGIVEGPVPLTPIQHRFFEQNLLEPHHWNQSVLLEVDQALESELLKATVQHLLAHHDALRLRFERGESGWQQVNAGVGSEAPFSWVDLSRLSEAERGPALETHATAVQASLDLTAGPLLRMAYFNLGAGQPGRLLIVVHHLAIDSVSWRVLMEDFQTVYGQLGRGQAVQLPPKTTSFQYWARRLVEYARSEAAREELPHWLVLAQNGAPRLPVDYPGGANTEASAHRVRVSLGVEETQVLLQEVPAAYGTEINDALLTALVQAVSQWSGSRALLLDLEGHGREDILDDVELSRTVGWFTTVYPVALDLEDADGPGEALKTVKEQLRRVPRRGIGYGLLRHLGEDEEVVRNLQAVSRAELSFNYLGQFGQALPKTGPFKLSQEHRGSERSLRGERSHLLSISGSIIGGRLQLEWIYSESLHRRTTIEGLAQGFVEALRALIAHCQSPAAGGYTPSDFPDAELSQEDVDALMMEIGEAIGGD